MGSDGPRQKRVEPIRSMWQPIVRETASVSSLALVRKCSLLGALDGSENWSEMAKCWAGYAFSTVRACVVVVAVNVAV